RCPPHADPALPVDLPAWRWRRRRRWLPRVEGRRHVGRRGFGCSVAWFELGCDILGYLGSASRLGEHRWDLGGCGGGGRERDTRRPQRRPPPLRPRAPLAQGAAAL